MERFILTAWGKNVADVYEHYATRKEAKARKQELYAHGYNTVLIADNKLARASDYKEMATAKVIKYGAWTSH